MISPSSVFSHLQAAHKYASFLPPSESCSQTIRIFCYPTAAHKYSRFPAPSQSFPQTFRDIHASSYFTPKKYTRG
ncbi:hypothetical protein BRYFOR_08040 [Marvinbryantia formatexigens DSM 14469]|uniref:Uncharacterized protein n=1 Tax=Marvinbryantia formatexigens DSM 14469 TaxID=478749 RepID=C6LHC8_9FIRM|nr:hypothetical protein BRYFOR_08040 [Marvinbryantia formatexigens DSM 14469]